MKIVLNSYTGIGAWFGLRLIAEGHSVDYHYIGKPNKGDLCLAGIIPEYIIGDIDYSKYDLSLFDLTGKPREAEKSLSQTPTLGDSKLASLLEDDRLFGIEIMEQAGINVPAYEVFDSIDAARKYVSKTKKRYVFKPNGGQDQGSMSTYVSSDWEDLLEYFDNLEQQSKGVQFILQEFVNGGVEISINGYFNGEDFYLPCATIEEKKFMNDKLGPNTGSAGNLVWCFADLPKYYKEGLFKMREYLAMNNYRGPVDLNTLLTENKLYGIEWTPRFGYDSTCCEFATIPQGALGDFLYGIAAGERVEHIQPYTGCYVGAVRCSIPPYPFEELKVGLQQCGVPLKLTPDDLKDFWLWDACLEDGKLCSCGQGYGVIGCPIATGDTPENAFDIVYRRLKNLKIPNLQYRTDITKQVTQRLRDAERMGWLRP